MDKNTALVVSAHSADFVWRAGGAIALHADQGYEVTIVCLSFGERGESQKLWLQEGMTLERVKKERQREAENAAHALGVHDIQFYNLGDYPLELGRDTLFRLADLYRALHPRFVITHSREDPFNFDHPATAAITQQARIVAQALGHKPGERALGLPQVYTFEPHQPEQCNWKPNVILNITEVWDKKRAAIECMTGQEYLWEYYTRVALNRGNQGARNAKKKMIYGEAYEAVFAQTVDLLG